MERPIKSASSWRRSGDTEREREATEDDVSSTEDWAEMVDNATARLCAGLQLNFTKAASLGTDTQREVGYQSRDFMVLIRYASTPGGNTVYKIRLLSVRQQVSKPVTTPCFSSSAPSIFLSLCSSDSVALPSSGLKQWREKKKKSKFSLYTVKT